MLEPVSQESPVAVGTMDAIPPALRDRVREIERLLPRRGGELEAFAAERLQRLLDDGEPWLGAEPALAELGTWMIEPGQAIALRKQGCVWLTMFPTADTARRLAAIALDPATPPPVVEQATWSLGYRQARAMHPSVRWTADAIQTADDALVKLADAATTAGRVTGQLPRALRHVSSDALSAVIARSPALWGEALECFASSALARVLFVCIDDIPAQHRLRALRLIAATLGKDALAMLVARATQAPIDERLEMQELAIAIGGEAHVGALEDTLRELQGVDTWRRRARWHLAHAGVIPTMLGLRTARTTGTMPDGERTPACARAADDFDAMTPFARYPEAYVYGLWGWMVRGAGDPVRARALVSAHPESQQRVRDLYLEDLGRRGRVKQLTAAAQGLAGADVGALWLAMYGRPLAALELAATARHLTPALACARALACYRAGRLDLTERILVEDLPPAEIVDGALPEFPGPHERWLRENGAASTALAALMAGRAAVLALAKPAADDAEADTPSIASTVAVVRRLGRGLPGSTVYLAGEFEQRDKEAIASAVIAAGARIVNGPFPGTDYYVHGDTCLVQTVAQLERQGTRRLRRDELPGGGL
jgi:hypothetical protein